MKFANKLKNYNWFPAQPLFFQIAHMFGAHHDQGTLTKDGLSIKDAATKYGIGFNIPNSKKSSIMS